MLINKDIYVHTNVPAIYRKHQFQLLAKVFQKGVFFFNENGTGYKFWSRDVNDWGVDCRSNWHRFPGKGNVYFNQRSLVELLRQRWGSVHLVASVSLIEKILLIVSGMIGHSIIISWNDAGFPDRVGRSPYKILQLVDRLWRAVCAGVFTPGALGCQYALALGYERSKIINSFFSHDVDLFRKYYKERGIKERKRIRGELKICDGKIVLLTISRFLDLKRLDDLAKAVVFIEKNESEMAKKIELILIGDGERRSHLDTLKTLTNIKFHHIGLVSPDEVLAYYCGADIFVFPSEGDIWGLVVNEALSMGLPVICTDRIGAAELVCDGVNGYKIPVRRSDLIANRIATIVKDDMLRKQLSVAAMRTPEWWRTELGVNALIAHLQDIQNK